MLAFADLAKKKIAITTKQMIDIFLIFLLLKKV